jgi:hypothetical protein
MFAKTISILFLSMVINAAVEARTVYKILGKPPLGSNLKPVEAKSPIPFDKEYHQLTEKQRRIYRTQWEGLTEDEIPPFPKRGTRSIYNPIIKGHERISRGGLLRLIAQIDEKGNVSEVAVYDSPHEDITELAIAVMFHTKFKPASCAGEPCKMDFPFEIDLRKRVKQMNTLNAEDIPGNE